MQAVILISSSVQVDDVSQPSGFVTETTTAETTPMNRTVVSSIVPKESRGSMLK